jgi:arsenate reductase
MLRKKEPLYAELGLAGKSPSVERVARLLAEHPRLLERPVLVKGARTVVARPAERTAEFLE